MMRLRWSNGVNRNWSRGRDVMALVSFNVLDGTDAGCTYCDLPTPVSIGREEGNTLRLNDERVSRFHLKVQEDQGHVVLTDLESTNGTRVNGEIVRVSLLRPGDQIRVGGTLLVYGSRDEILARMQRVAQEAETPLHDAEMASVSDPEVVPSRHTGAKTHKGPRPQPAGDAKGGASPDEPGIHPSDGPAPPAPPLASPWNEVWSQPPALPKRLSPAQAAQLTELLAALHRRLRTVIESVSIDRLQGKIQASLPAWQRVLSLQMDLARLMREIAEPDFEDF
jgi:hypothetical protein